MKKFIEIKYFFSDDNIKYKGIVYCHYKDKTKKVYISIDQIASFSEHLLYEGQYCYAIELTNGLFYFLKEQEYEEFFNIIITSGHILNKTP